MKKVIFSFFFLTIAVCANAQIMRTEELVEYVKEKYGEKINWEKAAQDLSTSLSLDKNKALTYVRVIECDGTTKEQLYIILNHWFSMTFNDANSVIKLNDKDSGCLIGEGCLAGIATHVGGMLSYKVDARPVIKLDIKDGKIRVTYTIQKYDVVIGGGAMAMLGGATVRPVGQSWALDDCFPFTDKKDKHKKASSKALVMVDTYSSVLLNMIEEAVKNGVVGNEGDKW